MAAYVCAYCNLTFLDEKNDVRIISVTLIMLRAWMLLSLEVHEINQRFLRFL